MMRSDCGGYETLTDGRQRRRAAAAAEEPAAAAAAAAAAAVALRAIVDATAACLAVNALTTGCIGIIF